MPYSSIQSSACSRGAGRQPEVPPIMPSVTIALGSRHQSPKHRSVSERRGDDESTLTPRFHPLGWGLRRGAIASRAGPPTPG
jgi:hypothetical protein